MAISLLQSAQVAGVSGSILTLAALFGLIIASGYLATTKSAVVLSKARKAYWTLLVFVIIGAFLGTTGSAYSRYPF